MMKPSTIYIETTTHCNADCIMCPHEKLKRQQETMSDDLFNHIINGISKYDISGTQIFLHKEGEPLCDQNIAKRISIARNSLKSATEVGISTNAMLMTETVADDLISSGMNVVFFSVDGASSNTYEKIRRKCKYDVVENNIRHFLEKRSRISRKIRVVMQMVLSDLNRHERKLYIDKWKDYDVEFFFKETHCYLDGKMSTFEKPNFSLQLSCCQDPFEILVYHVDGRASLCCWDYNCEYVIGHANDKDMMQLFNGLKSRFMRKKQLALDCYDIMPCNRCGRIFGKDKISDY